jgi:hypothetical protein
LNQESIIKDIGGKTFDFNEIVNMPLQVEGETQTKEAIHLKIATKFNQEFHKTAMIAAMNAK